MPPMLSSSSDGCFGGHSSKILAAKKPASASASRSEPPPSSSSVSVNSVTPDSDTRANTFVSNADFINNGTEDDENNSPTFSAGADTDGNDFDCIATAPSSLSPSLSSSSAAFAAVSSTCHEGCYDGAGTVLNADDSTSLPLTRTPIVDHHASSSKKRAFDEFSANAVDEDDANDDEEFEFGDDEEEVEIDSDAMHNGKGDTPPQDLLNDAKNLCNKLLRQGGMRMVGTDDLDELERLGGNSHALLYTVVVKNDNGELEILKACGMTGNGKVRFKHLDIKRRYGDRAVAVVVFDFDRIDSMETNNYIVGQIRAICEKYCKLDKSSLEQVTLDDAADRQAGNDPSFCLQLLLYYYIHQKAFRLRGLEKVIARLMLESGYQELLRTTKGGVKMGKGAHDASRHEAFCGKDFLHKAKQMNKDAAEDLNSLLDVLRNKFGDDYVKYLCDNPIAMKAMAAWAPGIGDTLSISQVIYDLIFGKSNWCDAYDSTPPEAHPYDATKFTPEQNQSACDNLTNFVKVAKESGSVRTLNTNKHAFTSMGTAAEEYLEKQGWTQLVEDGSGLKYYSYIEDGWTYPALLIVHNPPCNICNSDPKVKVNPKWVNSSRKAGKQMTRLLSLAIFLRQSNAPNKFSTDMKDHPLLGNFAFAQQFVEYLVTQVHYYRMGASALLKQFLSDPDFNALQYPHTKLILKRPGIISKAIYDQLRRQEYYRKQLEKNPLYNQEQHRKTLEKNPLYFQEQRRKRLERNPEYNQEQYKKKAKKRQDANADRIFRKATAAYNQYTKFIDSRKRADYISGSQMKDLLRYIVPNFPDPEFTDDRISKYGNVPLMQQRLRISLDDGNDELRQYFNFN